MGQNPNTTKMAQQITTAEQKEMIKEIITNLTKYRNEAFPDESDDGAICVKDTIALFQDALDTGLFFGNIFNTIENEYEHIMSHLA